MTASPTSRPLTAFSRKVLASIAKEPVPRNSINPGVADRLLRGDLVESVLLPSPYKLHKGTPIAHLRITEAGRREVTP
jgi:hypothetical protein